MNKRKGFILLWILVAVALFAMASAPVVQKLILQSDMKTRNILSDKADEIAYAGSKTMENFILTNFDVFYDRLDDEKKFETIFEIPFDNEGGIKRANVVATYVPLSDENKYEKVEIVSRAEFSDVEGIFKQTLYYSGETEEVARGEVFSEDVYFDAKDSDGTPIKKLKGRMGIETIPELLTDTHLNWLKNNSNYVEAGNAENVSSENIQLYINKLIMQQNKSDYVKKDQHMIIYNWNCDVTDMKIDLSGLDAPDGEMPTLIIVLNSNMTVQNSLEVENGNVVFLTKGYLNLYLRSEAFNIIQNPQNCQITFGSNISFTLTHRYSMENIFFYLPNNASTHFDNTSLKTGGYIAQDYQIDHSSVFNQEKHIRVQWKGKPEYFGYYIE
ncbi:MAG: type II secretion system protein [Lachnospirales bacterium]